MEAAVEAYRKYLGAWPNQAASYFESTWGISPSTAVKFALLYGILSLAGLSPRITSGWRDPKKQAALRADWDAGRRAGLVVRPADPDTSRHCRTGLTGAPASTGIDMPCSNNAVAAAVAKVLGLRAGLYFSTPDPGHYDGG